jgi:hypothetical protein
MNVEVKSVKPFRLLAGLGLAVLSSTALAHHSGAMFESEKTRTLEGTITEFNWVNPHSSFKVAVKDDAGREEIWAIEMNAPQNLIRAGWKRTTLKPGDPVTVVVRPLRDGKPGGTFVAVTLADGTNLGGRE